MEISKTLVAMFNKQIALESVASQKYLGTATWCELSGYPGGAAYFYAQSDEERVHMLKIIKFLTTLGIKPELADLEKTVGEHDSLEDALKTALAAEQKVTASIHDILTYANENREYAVLETLMWFVSEQTQEETKFQALLQNFETIGRDPLAVAEIDKILASQAGI